MNFRPNQDDRMWRDPHEGGWFRFTGPWRFLLIIILIVCLLVGLWYVFSPARKSFQTADLPFIQADEGPVKVKAEDQGVPNIKHQDKLIYNRISGERKEAHVEHILPDPETPKELFNDSSPLQMIDQYMPEDIDPNEPDKPKKADKTLLSIEDLIDGIPEASPPSKVVKRSGTVYIQLASLRSYESAESEWSRLSKKHRAIFNGFQPVIQKVDLGASQGIFYRLRTGPFETEAKAKKFCERLKEKKVKSHVIR